MKKFFFVLLITILASCGGCSTSDSNSADAWPETASLIDSFMGFAEQDFQSAYHSRAGSLIARLAASGATSSSYVGLVANEASVPADDFIEDVHQYVFDLAVTRRIDRDGMTQLMEKYRQSLISNVENHLIRVYGQSDFDNVVGMGVENSIGSKFDKELLVMAQLW